MTHPSSTRRLEGPRQHDLTFFTGPKSFRKWIFYFHFGKSTPTINFKNFPLVLREIGLRTFANPLVKRLVSNLRNSKTVNADPSSFSFRLYLIAISTVAMSSDLFPRFPKPDFLKFRRTHKVDLSTPLYFY
jgi:hypothetical protein